MKEKVVLAYSGGLDTTAIIPWLKENFDYEVICVCVNCGQAEELDGLEERAKACGASKLYIEDVIDEFCDDYIATAAKTLHNEVQLGRSESQGCFALMKWIHYISLKEDPPVCQQQLSPYSFFSSQSSCSCLRRSPSA